MSTVCIYKLGYFFHFGGEQQFQSNQFYEKQYGRIFPKFYAWFKMRYTSSFSHCFFQQGSLKAAKFDLVVLLQNTFERDCLSPYLINTSSLKCNYLISRRRRKTLSHYISLLSNNIGSYIALWFDDLVPPNSCVLDTYFLSEFPSFFASTLFYVFLFSLQCFKHRWIIYSHFVRITWNIYKLNKGFYAVLSRYN